MDQKKREFSMAELTKLSSRHNLHLLISSKVYDVHKFIHEHPGGDLVLLGEGGKDATKSFEDVQHTDDAKELMEGFLVGYHTQELDENQETQKIQIKQGITKNRFASTYEMLSVQYPLTG